MAHLHEPNHVAWNIRTTLKMAHLYEPKHVAWNIRTTLKMAHLYEPKHVAWNIRTTLKLAHLYEPKHVAWNISINTLTNNSTTVVLDYIIYIYITLYCQYTTRMCHLKIPKQLCHGSSPADTSVRLCGCSELVLVFMNKRTVRVGAVRVATDGREHDGTLYCCVLWVFVEVKEPFVSAWTKWQKLSVSWWPEPAWWPYYSTAFFCLSGVLWPQYILCRHILNTDWFMYEHFGTLARVAFRLKS
jgi:hypothetical protein